MIQNLSLAVDMTTLLAGNAFAEVHEVQMLNRAADARRAFEPAFLQIAVATPSNSWQKIVATMLNQSPRWRPKGRLALKVQSTKKLK